MDLNILLEILPVKKEDKQQVCMNNSLPLCVYIELLLHTWLYLFSHSSQRYWASRSFL